MSEDAGRARAAVPRHSADENAQAAVERRRFIQERTGAALAHVGYYSVNPAVDG